MDKITPRNTIRARGSVTGATGKTSRMIRRWNYPNPKPDTTLARLEQAYWAGLKSVDLVEARTLRNKTNGKFTREGARDDVLHYTLHELIPNLHKSRTAIRKAKAEIAERRAKLRHEPVDKSDMAAAVRRMEIRSLLRQMSDADQRSYLTRDRLPSEVIAAVLEMPPELSGVPKGRHDMLAQSSLAARHGPEIADIMELEAAVSAAESTVELARDELRLEVGGINKQKFDELAAPIEAKHVAPWLRRRGGEVHVVDLERRVERQPTPEEMATGIFAATHDEYVREQTTVTAAA